MRDRTYWHESVMRQLRDPWQDETQADIELGTFVDVELGLYLIDNLPGQLTASDVWTLLSGYPFADTTLVVSEQHRHWLKHARHYLWPVRRRHEWRTVVAAYLKVSERLRGYNLDAVDDVPTRRSPACASNRFDIYTEVLQTLPPLRTVSLPVAPAGHARFYQQSQLRGSMFLPTALTTVPPLRSHDLATADARSRKPVTVEWSELEGTAEDMDRLERDWPEAKRNNWAARLADVELQVRENDALVPGPLHVDQLLHLVGMVGAGKSTLRDILAVHLVTQRNAHVTIMVGDVADVLAIVERFRRLGVAAAPVLGRTTLEQNIIKHHRRQATRGSGTMLEHHDPGFAWLSSACPADALRGAENRHSLPILDAPCSNLYPDANHVDEPAADVVDAPVDFLGENDLDDTDEADTFDETGRRHSCPLYAVCPRHVGSRELVDAAVWVATPASLVHSRVPNQINAERITYLEAAALRSDLIMVDEADRVQMQLDAAFAPAVTLVAQGEDSWIDEVNRHKSTVLQTKDRLPLRDRGVDRWSSAMDTIATAANRIYSLLINNEDLRGWITQDYFSALTLHRWLISNWFPEPNAGATPSAEDARIRARDRVETILNAFRDDPLGAGAVPDGLTNDEPQIVIELRNVAASLLHQTDPDSEPHRRLAEVLHQLAGDVPEVRTDVERVRRKLEFTLVLAVLHHETEVASQLWPRVDVALNLERTSNTLSRNPPPDFEPVIPDSPMGNVLGFQFEPTRRNSRSGRLSFFRLRGVGRELLLELPNLAAEPGIGTGPQVLLLSATSWAGRSTRYHVHHDVGGILKPRQKSPTNAVHGSSPSSALPADQAIDAAVTTFTKRFVTPRQDVPEAGLKVAQPIRISGITHPGRRRDALTAMITSLATPDASGSPSLLARDLEHIPDEDRRRALLLVGSYDEAEHTANLLYNSPEWEGRVTQLVPDDAGLDHTWQTPSASRSAPSRLSRGNTDRFSDTDHTLLVAPLLAVERGHNIVLPDGRAAIGSVYFLVRPHPRPDDIRLAINAINDWAIRQARATGLEPYTAAGNSLDAMGQSFRKAAGQQFNHYLTRIMAFTALRPDEKRAFTWDQLVVIWQVIGRLLRGGQAAQVYFVDAQFSPNEARALGEGDTASTSLLEAMREELHRYIDPSGDADPFERQIVTALFMPLYRALCEMI